jgi:hypothetical protein
MELVVTTKEELAAIVADAVSTALDKRVPNDLKEVEVAQSTLIYGIMGLANFLGVSMTTAQKFKNERVFPCIQRGRTLIFKSEEVLAGLSKKKSRF